MNASKRANGHANGNGAAHKHARPADDGVARAEAHARGLARLRDDALAQLERASSARTSAEAAHGEAVQVHAAALRASGAKPDDDGLLDAVSRAAARVSRERGALDVAVGEHQRCATTAQTAAGALEGAEREHQRLALEADILDPRRCEALEARGRRIVDLVAEIHAEAVAIAGDLDAEAELVARAKQLGSSLTPGDGLVASRGFARALLEHGIDLGASEVHPIRWALLRPVDRPPPPVGRVVLDLVGLVVQAFMRAPSPNGRTALEQAVQSWSTARSFAEVQRAAAAPAPQPVEDGWLATKQTVQGAQPTRALHESSMQWAGDLEPGDAPDRDRV